MAYEQQIEKEDLPTFEHPVHGKVVSGWQYIEVDADDVEYITGERFKMESGKVVELFD